MRKFLGILLLLASGQLFAVNGLLVEKSDFGVDKTADRLESILKEKGFKIFNRIHHAAGAKSVGIDLRPTQLIIFGKPAAGSKFMTSKQTSAIDLPMKYLVWKGADGKVRIGWNDPAWIANRHDIKDRKPLVAKMKGAIRGMAKAAAH